VTAKKERITRACSARICFSARWADFVGGRPGSSSWPAGLASEVLQINYEDKLATGSCSTSARQPEEETIENEIHYC